MLMTIIAAFLAFIAIAGVGVAVAGQPSANARTLKRAQAVVGKGDTREGAKTARRSQVAQQDNRRKQILKTLRDQDKQAKKATVTIAARLQQAGLGDNVRRFWIISGVLGAVVAMIAVFLRQPPLIAIVLGAAAAFGLPRWVVGFLAARRLKTVTDVFPDAMDIIVRGIKSGLPVHDSLRVISQETQEPMAGEFKRLVENIGMGVSIEQSLDKMFERMPIPEVKFFAIVLNIQSKTGGNLAEALGGLSTVIRARKLMREKIKALSGEAVASAIIIGSLPPGVVLMISIINPAYMAPMFIDPRGKTMLIGGLIWMAIGIFTMRKMINFKI